MNYSAQMTDEDLAERLRRARVMVFPEDTDIEWIKGFAAALDFIDPENSDG